MTTSRRIEAHPREDLAPIRVNLLNDLPASPLDRADAATEQALQVRGDACGVDARGLSRLMGGTVRIDSRPGRDPRVSLDLPLPPAAAAAPVAPRPDMPTKAAPAATDTWAKLSVLVVADNAVNRLVLRSMLEAVGIQADTVCDGHEALGLWKIRRHELIIMDIAMPVMDGMGTLATIREIAEQAGHPRPVAFAVRASARRAHLENCHAAGFDRCLAKPVRRSELEAALCACWPPRG